MTPDANDAPTIGAEPRRNASESEAPPRLERYEATALLGEGGMGRVYRAFDRALKRWVALKVLRSDDPALVQRFLSEAELQARIVHPNVCKVYEAGRDGTTGAPYIAMQLVDGGTLDDLADQLSYRERVAAVREAAEGLHAAHRLGLIHRDVKPANVMVERTSEGRLTPYVMDFGLARLANAEGATLSGTVIGTPSYMPPEQALGRVHEVDVRSDVYSLGATLYTVLAGRPPFSGATPLATLDLVVREEPRPLSEIAPDVPADLATIVAKCLAKEPSRRYDSARELSEDLARFLEGAPVSARRATLTYRISKTVQRNRAAFAVGLAALLALLALLGLFVRSRLDAARQAALADTLSRDVREIESLMRYAAYLPVHDVNRERSVVRTRLLGLYVKARDLGRLGLGPLHDARGRGYLALEEYDSARQELFAAWDMGYRPPGTASALGQALMGLYGQGRVALNTAASREEREQREAALERDVKKPALEMLLLGEREGGDTWMGHARIAYLRGEWDRAANEASRALAEQPWLYEAASLRGEALDQKALELGGTGRQEEAASAYAEAEAAFEEALRIARSHPASHRALCGLFGNVMYLEKERGGDVSARFAKAAEVCDAAIAVDPLDAAILVRYSDVYWQWGQDLLSRGRDPREALARSVQAAEATLGSDENPAYTLDNIGLAHTIAAQWEERTGGDPEPSLALAVAAFEKAIGAFPSFSSGHNNLGCALNAWARVDVKKGRDPRPRLDRAMALLRKARDLKPHAEHYVNLAEAHLLKADWARRTGQGEPAAEVASARREVAAGRALNSGHKALKDLEARLPAGNPGGIP